MAKSKLIDRLVAAGRVVPHQGARCERVKKKRKRAELR